MQKRQAEKIRRDVPTSKPDISTNINGTNSKDFDTSSGRLVSVKKLTKDYKKIKSVEFHKMNHLREHKISKPEYLDRNWTKKNPISQLKTYTFFNFRQWNLYVEILQNKTHTSEKIEAPKIFPSNAPKLNVVSISWNMFVSIRSTAHFVHIRTIN